MSFKGKKKRYYCDRCGREFITIDRDEGTTPFITSCQNEDPCTGSAYSQLYRIDQSLTPTHEWYRATDDEAMKMKLHSREHHGMGGLFLRKISEVVS